MAPNPNVVGGIIYNLNFRGRRGNIVQCYPAVEYDFVPNRLALSTNDALHIQFHGSDFNEALNANNGEGWQYSDRMNMVQYGSATSNFPLPLSQQTMFSTSLNGFQPSGTNARNSASTSQAVFWGLLGQTICTVFADNGKDANRNDITNCGKLNSAPNRFPPNPYDGLTTMPAGTYYYASTRNNNFSNRSNKAVLSVAPYTTALSSAQIAGIVIGTLAGVGLLVGSALFYGKRHPNSRAGVFYAKTADCFASLRSKITGRTGRGETAGKTTSWPAASTSTSTSTRPDMEYTRH